MQTIYERPILEITLICEEVVRTSVGGWKEGDNDITWNGNEGD